MRGNLLTAAAAVTAFALPAPLYAHGGHAAADPAGLHALVHLLPGLLPAAALGLGVAWITLDRRGRSNTS